VVASSLALSQARRAAKVGAGGGRLRGMLVQLLESPGRTSPGFLLLFASTANRPHARHYSVGDMQRKPLGWRHGGLGKWLLLVIGPRLEVGTSVCQADLRGRRHTETNVGWQHLLRRGRWVLTPRFLQQKRAQHLQSGW